MAGSLIPRSIDAQVADQAEIAVEQADVVVLVVDTCVGVTASDVGRLCVCCVA